MVEVVQWVANYLMIGVLIQFVLQGLARVLDSPKLDVKESVVTILIWPVAVCLFTWFFVKGLGRKSDE